MTCPELLSSRSGIFSCLRRSADRIQFLPRKTFMHLFASQSPGSGLVGNCSQVARSLVSALEHVGKHHCGVGSRLACGGSTGIAAGFTGCESTGKVVGDELHAVSSSASGSSISHCLIDVSLPILSRLVD